MASPAALASAAAPAYTPPFHLESGSPADLREPTMTEPASAGSPSQGRPSALSGTGARAEASPGRLPVPLTSFVGREGEIAEVEQAQAGARLLTLTGAGGAGKTRLAGAVAERSAAADRFADGVFWVDLVPLADGELVAQSVAGALQVGEQPGESLGVTLSGFLASRRVLLVLDNCEHVGPAVARLLVVLLSACPGLCVLATSRASLGVPGEVVWPVPPLSVEAGPSAAGELGAIEAVRLFVDRARAAAPGFRLTQDNAWTVLSICRRLDGLPLAIELAAARTPVLTAVQILVRLDDSLRLLTRGAATEAPHHKTLRATLDWSHALLDASEQRLFRRLGVFAGGFTLEATEAVCADGDDPAGAGTGLAVEDVLDRLADLLEKSLVVLADRQAEAEARYRLLEPIRQYAVERLEAAGEQAAVRARHAGYFLALAEAAEPELTGAAAHEWYERLQRDLGNLRAALDWGLGDDGDDETAPRLLSALWRFAQTRGHIREAAEWADRVVARLPDRVPAAVRARAHYAVGVVFGALGRKDAIDQVKLALDLFTEQDDRLGMAWALNDLGWLTLTIDAAGPAQAAVYYLASVEHKRAIGNAWDLAITLTNLGEVARMSGDYEAAEAYFTEVIELPGAIGDKQTGDVLHNLGHLALHRHEVSRAESRFREGLALHARLGYRRGAAECLAGLASVHVVRGEAERATVLFGASAGLLDAAGVRLDEPTHSEVQAHVDAARTRLGEAAWKAAWQRGWSQPADDLAALVERLANALPDEAPAAATTPLTPALPGGLTAREREVAVLLAAGLTNDEIADELTVVSKTVEKHVTNILSKLGFDNRAQVAAWAVARGLAEAPEDLDALAEG